MLYVLFAALYGLAFVVAFEHFGWPVLILGSILPAIAIYHASLLFMAVKRKS